MTTVLHIDSSANLTTSTSRAKSVEVVNDLNPTKVIRLDLATTPLALVDQTWIEARMVPAADQTDEDKATLTLSDTLITELQAADTIVIGTPMYNFGAPAVLKAWMDLVARPKVTFYYDNGKPVGLLTGKKAIIVAASGGVPFGSDTDYMTPHLKHFLDFLGIIDIDLIPAT